MSFQYINQSSRAAVHKHTSVSAQNAVHRQSVSRGVDLVVTIR